MKAKVIMAGTILFLASILTSTAQDHKDYIWSYNGGKKEHTLGLYAGINSSYTRMMDKDAGWLGYRAGLVLDKRWVVGVGGDALWYDYALTELAENGTYHLQAGYQGIFVEYLQPIGSRVKIGFSILSGQGLVKYEYDKDFRKDKPWFEEIIDQSTFQVFEPGIEIQARIGGNWWLGLHGTYRNTSPVELLETSECVFRTLNGGITLKYGIF
ncbi:MAG: hypothetical protein Q7J34_02460 [Bacteroidales bacterium]|jgi:hypothetical protein|nr:hypothetical protein [Bacteroidales bacterium]